MTLQGNWNVVPLSQLEDDGIKMANRFAASASISKIFPERVNVFETMERDGLGPWSIVSIADADGRVLVFGNAEFDDPSMGAAIWTTAGITLAEVTEIVAEVSASGRCRVIKAD